MIDGQEGMSGSGASMKIGVVGPGFMGTQISLHCATRGHSVCLVGRSSTSLDRAAKVQRETLGLRLAAAQLTKSDVDSITDRILLTTSADGPLSDADIVVETIPESVDAKRRLFSHLDSICCERTILASNSSSIRISVIETATQRADRVLNMHFWAPVWQTTMVELMGGSETSSGTMQTARRFAESLGLTPLIARKESTGFVFNRVWHAIKKECLQLVDQGIASPDEIDQAWKLFTSMPYGPFFMMDVTGLDVIRDIETVYCSQSGLASDAPPQVLLDMVARGELGAKTGRGFYAWPAGA